MEAEVSHGGLTAAQTLVEDWSQNLVQSAFAFITRSREFNKLFAAYMKGVSAREGTAVRHLLTDYDWAQLDQGLKVHIDGGPGTVCVALAEAFPHPRFAIQDSAEQINQSRSFLKSQLEPNRTANELGIYDHYNPQPVPHANVYLLWCCTFIPTPMPSGSSLPWCRPCARTQPPGFSSSTRFSRRQDTQYGEALPDAVICVLKFALHDYGIDFDGHHTA